MAQPIGETRPDLLAIPWASLVLWRLPTVAMVAVVVFDADPTLQAAVWAPCLALFAAGCIANAARCRRVHCYFTGPFFALMAVAALTYGLGVLPLGPSGWNWIELATVVGAVVFTYLPEALWGRYFAAPPSFER